MGMRIFWLLVFIAACVGGYFMYQHYSVQKQGVDGEVTCTGCMTPDEKARFDKENSGDVADGNSEHKIRTSRQEEAAGNPEGAAAAGQTTTTATTSTTSTAPATAPAATTTTTTKTTAPVATAPVPAPYQPPVASGSYVSTKSGSLPVSDSQSPNAANGTRFGGSGHYEWYRQGNLTWRLDPANGGSCIAFATLEEWRKQIVYSHGCGRGA